MKTPAGKECRFYYANFHRGHSDQECRLMVSKANSETWTPSDCSLCPVPEILQANSSPNLVLEGKITTTFWRFGRKVVVRAYCTKHLIDVPVPQVGCPECAKERPGLDELFGKSL